MPCVHRYIRSENKMLQNSNQKFEVPKPVLKSFLYVLLNRSYSNYTSLCWPLKQDFDYQKFVSAIFNKI